jgi:hypothetical protein
MTIAEGYSELGERNKVTSGPNCFMRMTIMMMTNKYHKVVSS